MRKVIQAKLWVLMVTTALMSLYWLAETCRAQDSPWPMYLSAISARQRCAGEWHGIDTGTYESRVAKFKAQYCKSDTWESWILANKPRYAATFAASQGLPDTIIISFRYETTPINYTPPWISETEHMSVFTAMAKGAYPNYNFNIVFNGNTITSYANVVAGIAGSTSYAYGKNVYLKFETIFNHEFGHVMKLLHHYDTTGEVGDGKHMPPGESQCIMDRNSSLFCSACRTALGIPLDISDAIAVDEAIDNILSRYP